MNKEYRIGEKVLVQRGKYQGYKAIIRGRPRSVWWTFFLRRSYHVQIFETRDVYIETFIWEDEFHLYGGLFA